MWIAETLAAFVRRDWATAVSYRLPFALDIVAAILSLTLFFYLGQLIDRSRISEQPGLERGYFAFVVVGLALMQLGQTGLTSFAQRLRQEQTTGTFEALMTTPTPSSLVIVASATYDLLRASVAAVITLVVAIVVFGLRLGLSVELVPIVLVALASAVLVFAMLGVVLAAFTVVYKQLAALTGMVMTGLALLSGVYFPIKVLPDPLELVARVSPLTWGLDVLRGALLAGRADLLHLALLSSFAIVTVPVALAAFATALTRARREGTLGEY